MQNDRVLEAITWNPWHGCHKCSAGCANCFVFMQDSRYGRDTTVVEVGKTTYRMPNFPLNALVKLCFSSDFFIAEADAWRKGVWDQMRQRPDCTFVTTTKRPERIAECVPDDWGDGWPNVHISTSIENQEMADIRVPALLRAPVTHKEVFVSPLIGPVSLDAYLRDGQLRCVNVGCERAPYSDVRPASYDWVWNLYCEARKHNVEFYFHQTGNYLVRNGVNIGAWNMKEEIRAAEEIQKDFDRMYIDYEKLLSRL